MANKLQRRTASRRKLQLKRTLNNSKSVKRSSIIFNVLLHFHKVRAKLEEIQREYQGFMAIRNEYFTLLDHMQIPKEDVKVEKKGEGFVVKVRCKIGGDKLVSIMDALEEVGVNVVQVRVCSNHFFGMEATVVDHHQQTTDIKDITQAVQKVIQKQGGKGMLVGNVD
ncbi:Detected protein of unknown function [Hibiscus syriacus]|uniref:Plant bHLH transcription factor ACT-like domain-containing protein n=1 Tax=Hibiscus syriacus TaxID=106335 RepID=A0A6A3BJP2_HIBSY|nr:Detected protein of unknown function [Hibiscus syriacus]